MTSRRQHWDTVYRTRDPQQVSWYQEDPARSLALIESTGVSTRARLIDVGGGASRLVDHLLAAGFVDVTVLDVAEAALAHARDRLGSAAGEVTWIEGDVTTYPFARRYDLWHDRAVFHFLCDEADRNRYGAQVRTAVAPGGHVIIATFGLDGPDQCSGLPIVRYDSTAMTRALGPGFAPVGFEEELHRTPAGGSQHFLYGHFRRVATGEDQVGA